MRKATWRSASALFSEVFSRPDWDYVALIIVCALIVCAAAFAVGRLAGAMLHAPRPELVSLVFGLGMSNNGTGMVLAASALSDHANVLLVILRYNLGQQLIAALADSTKTAVAVHASVLQATACWSETACHVSPAPRSSFTC